MLKDDYSDPMSQKLEQIFREVLNDPDLRVRDDLSVENSPAWDSLTHISLLFSIESAFGVTFSDEEMSSLDSAGALREALVRRALWTG
jgi:acyl carrier protein